MIDFAAMFLVPVTRHHVVLPPPSPTKTSKPSICTVTNTTPSQAGHETHGQPAGKVLTVDFKISNTPFVALNGGPQFKFTEAVSFQVDCKDQAEVDYYWGKLLEGGGTESECGWLKDKFGLSWQIVPVQLKEWLSGEDKEGAKRAMEAMMKMVKMDITRLKEAFER